jgi:hypothetical protein
MAVKNQGPEKVAPSALETRVVATVGAGREVMRMSTHNTGGFELRASQESGTH